MRQLIHNVWLWGGFGTLNGCFVLNKVLTAS
jgi:hypothetical protein